MSTIKRIVQAHADTNVAPPLQDEATPEDRNELGYEAAAELQLWMRLQIHLAQAEISEVGLLMRGIAMRCTELADVGYWACSSPVEDHRTANDIRTMIFGSVDNFLGEAKGGAA